MDYGEFSRSAEKQRYALKRDEDDAMYEAGRERCDVLGGNAKEVCMADLRKRYAKVAIRKPAASRKRSPEVYALAQGKLAAMK